MSLTEKLIHMGRIEYQTFELNRRAEHEYIIKQFR
jgi:hypothetical protein